MCSKKEEKKEKTTDEAYYATKIDDLHKKNISRKTHNVEEYDNDNANIEFLSTDIEDKEVWRSAHGVMFVTNVVCTGATESKSFMISISNSDFSYWSLSSKADSKNEDSDLNSQATCLSGKSVSEHVASCEKVVDKVHSILKSLNISTSHYDDELTELRETISKFNEGVRWNRRKVSNLSDDLSRCSFKTERIRLRIDKLVSDIVRILTSQKSR